MEILQLVVVLCAVVFHIWFVWRMLQTMEHVAALLREVRALKASQETFNAEMLAGKDKVLRQGEQAIEALVTIQETQEA